MTVHQVVRGGNALIQAMHIDKFISLGIGILLSGCAQTDLPTDNAIDIDLNTFVDETSRSVYVDSVTYLPLETTDECLIGHIKSISVLDSLFLILDNKTETVLAFDKSGHFRYQIGNQGEGPEEYITATQIDVSPSKGEIYVYDNLGSKVLCYDTTGRYINKIETVGYAFDFAYWEENGDRGFLFVDNRKKEDIAGIIRHDLNTGAVKRLVARPTKFESNSVNDFYHSNGKVFVAAPPFNNDIYRVSGDSVVLVLALNIYPKPSQKDINNGVTEHMQSFLRTRYSLTSRWLSMPFWSGANGVRMIIYDTKTGKHIVSKRIKDELNPNTTQFLPICIDDMEIAVAPAENPDDNPMLAFYHYKK